MKKLMTLTLVATLAISTVDATTVFAKTIEYQYNDITTMYEAAVSDAASLKTQIGQQPNDVVATFLKDKVSAIFAFLDDREKKKQIYNDYGQMESDDFGDIGYITPLNIPKTIHRQLQELDAIAQQLDGAAEATHQLLQQRIKNTYKEFDLYYENGALLDGIYEGNLYKDGELLGAALNIAYENTETSFLKYAYRRIVAQKDEAEIKENLQAYIDAATKNIEAANDIVKAAQDPEYPKVTLNTDIAMKTINDSTATLRFIQNVMNMYEAQAHMTKLHRAIEEGFTLLGKQIDFTAPNAQANYQNIKLLEVLDGRFDDQGFAYFKVDLSAVAGNYTFVGNADVASYTTFATDDVSRIHESMQLGGREVRYLENGTYAIAIKGEPNARYHFKLKRRTYNVETMKVLTAASKDYDTVSVAKIPIYQKNQPSIKVKFTTNQRVQFLVKPSNTTPVDENGHVIGATVIDAIELKHTQTDKIYKTQKLTGYDDRFVAFVPNGTYTVSLKSTSPSLGQHVALRYFLAPMLPLNEKVSYRKGHFNTFSFVPKKDTKIKFTLSAPSTNIDRKFKLYNDEDQLVKRVTLKAGDRSRTFTYTVKKGRYYLKVDDFHIKTKVVK